MSSFFLSTEAVCWESQQLEAQCSAKPEPGLLLWFCNTDLPIAPFTGVEEI